MDKILTGFCFTDIHNQQAMLDYPTTVRKSLVEAKRLAIAEFGLADIAIIGGDNISDYPHWNKSCALPKKNFLDLKAKMHQCVSESAKDGKVLYVAGNNDMILGDIATEDNAPYNTTDFYDYMDKAFGELPESEKTIIKAVEKPDELYWGAFHYVVNGVDFIGINIDPNTAYNSHEGYYSNETMLWVKNKLDEIDPEGNKCVFVIGHLSAIYVEMNGELRETMINGDRELFYGMFKGHRNAFYLYGHLHGEKYCYKEYSSGAILHLDGQNMPIDANLAAEDSKGKQYDLTLVHMGGLRPFNKIYFETDGLEGYGGEGEKKHFPHTATPALAQYLVFEVYSDRVVFYMRNAGSLEAYNKNDILKEYTVYLA